MRDIYASSDLAQSAASAKLNQLMSNAATLNVTMPGNPELFAEAKINLSGFRKGVHGDWIINRAEHMIDRSSIPGTFNFSTYLTCVRGEYSIFDKILLILIKS